MEFSLPFLIRVTGSHPVPPKTSTEMLPMSDGKKYYSYDYDYSDNSSDKHKKHKKKKDESYKKYYT